MKRLNIKYAYQDIAYPEHYKAYLDGVVLTAEELNTSIEIVSPYKGEVILVTDEDKYLGLVVVVQHEDKLIRYMNMDESYVEVGDTVKKGTSLGTFGLGLNNSINKDLHLSISQLDLPDLLAWSCVYDCEYRKYFLDPSGELASYGVVI